jgi:ribose transport system permease protein
MSTSTNHGSEPVATADRGLEGGDGPGAPGWTRHLRSVAGRYSLVGIWLVMVLGFGVVTPDAFLRISSVKVIVGSQSVLLFLALAALCTLVVGEFDLSFASIMGLTATLVAVLAEQHAVDIVVACLVGLLVSAACGALNAVFVVRFGISSLVVTLGTASLFLGLAEMLSGQTTVAVFNPALTRLVNTQILGIPLSFYYGIGACFAFGYILKRTATGRHVMFVGANRDVARLAGVNVDRIRMGSYLLAGLVSGLSGIILVGSIGGFDPTGGAVYLLPALSAVFLGTAVVHPGRFNPFGTLIALLFLATGIYGLQLMGFTGWVQDVFYGFGLLAAISIAHFVRHRSKSNA